MFSGLSERKIIILATLILLLANAFNLIMSKNLWFGKGLKTIHFGRRHLKTFLENEKMLCILFKSEFYHFVPS